jgi:hypothetical protein
MKRLLYAFLVIVPLLFNSCHTIEPEGIRIGAVCKDGTTSSATGSGACSYHGGVDHWIYR